MANYKVNIELVKSLDKGPADLGPPSKVNILMIEALHTYLFADCKQELVDFLIDSKVLIPKETEDKPLNS